MFRPTTVDGAIGAVSKSLRHLQHVTERHQRKMDAKLEDAAALRGRASSLAAEASAHGTEAARAARIHGKLAELVA